MTPTDAGLRWVRPPQQARSQETLDRILDAAELLIADKGVDDASVAEIVRRAGSSVGAFYTRFRDKDGLVNALYERYYEQAVATADDALEPARWDGAGIADLLAAVLRFLVSIYREQNGLIRAFVARNHTHPEFQARHERLSHHISERLSALLLARRQEITHPDPAAAAGFGLALVFSTLDSVMLFGEMRSALRFSDERIADELTRAYLSYLGVPLPHTATRSPQ